MVRVNVDIDPTAYKVFRDLVGEGKVSQAVRNYISSYSSGSDVNEAVLLKRFDILGQEKAKVDAEYFAVKEKLGALKSKRDAEEMVRLEAEKGQMEQMSQIKHDTVKARLWRMIPHD